MEEKKIKYWKCIDLLLKIILSGILDKPNGGKEQSKKKREEKELLSPLTLASIIREIIGSDPEIGNVYFNENRKCLFWFGDLCFNQTTSSPTKFQLRCDSFEETYQLDGLPSFHSYYF